MVCASLCCGYSIAQSALPRGHDEAGQASQLEGMPLQLYGRHSLESYGHRLNEFKGDFGKDTDWKEWSQEMEDYCVQDVLLTTKLWQHFQPYLNSSN